MSYILLEWGIFNAHILLEWGTYNSHILLEWEIFNAHILLEWDIFNAHILKPQLLTRSSVFYISRHIFDASNFPCFFECLGNTFA